MPVAGYLAAEAPCSHKGPSWQFGDGLKSQAIVPVVPGRGIEDAGLGVAKRPSKRFFSINLFNMLHVLPGTSTHHAAKKVILV